MKTTDVLKKIYAWLDGNKTIICAGIWYFLNSGIVTISSEWMDMINWIMGTLTAGALGDHVRKGYFSTTKGN